MADAAPYDSDFEEEVARLEQWEHDSDDESVDDEPTPTNGYFRPRTHPRGIFVQRPELEAQEAKEREASEDAATSRRSQSVDASSSRRPVWPEESGPILDAGPAPPDYAAATADRRGQSPVFASNHPLVRNGLVHSAMEPRGEPQSMSDGRFASRPQASRESAREESLELENGSEGESLSDERTGLVSGQRHNDTTEPKTQRRRGCLGLLLNGARWRTKSLLVGLVILGVIVVLVATKTFRKHPGNEYKEPNWMFKAPVVSPNKDPTPPHPSIAKCPWGYNSGTELFEVQSGEDFEFEEKFGFGDFAGFLPSYEAMTGRIHISLASEEQEKNGSDIRVFINVAVTKDLTLLQSKGILAGYRNDQRTSLELDFPALWFPGYQNSTQVDGQQRSEGQCMDVSVAIQVRRRTRIHKWEILTSNMNITVADDFFSLEGLEPKSLASNRPHSPGLPTANSTRITTHRGNIDVPFWSARSCFFGTTTGYLNGSFAFHDSLTLDTRTGDLRAEAYPQEQKDNCYYPEECQYPSFSASSDSGSVEVFFPPLNEEGKAVVPAREYNSIVSSMDGDIHARCLLGTDTDIQSWSGKIDVELLPTPRNFENATLWTTNGVSKTAIRILPPSTLENYHGNTTLDVLQANFDSMASAMVDLSLPDSWVGVVDTETVSGHIDLRGKLQQEVDEQLQGWPGQLAYSRKDPGSHRHVVARHTAGPGLSKLRVHTDDGDVVVKAGEGVKPRRQPRRRRRRYT